LLHRDGHLILANIKFKELISTKLFCALLTLSTANRNTWTFV